MSTLTSVSGRLFVSSVPFTLFPSNFHTTVCERSSSTMRLMISWLHPFDRIPSFSSAACFALISKRLLLSFSEESAFRYISSNLSRNFGSAFNIFTASPSDKDFTFLRFGRNIFSKKFTFSSSCFLISINMSELGSRKISPKGDFLNCVLINMTSLFAIKTCIFRISYTSQNLCSVLCKYRQHFLPSLFPLSHL